MTHIGTSPTRPEDKRLLAGAGKFMADQKLVGMAHATFHRSIHAHAKVLRVDTSAARAIPGVIGVLTAESVKSHIKPISPNWTVGNPSIPIRLPLADDVARMEGEPIAMIVAKTEEIARQASEAIVVTYDVMDAVSNEEDAIAESAPQLHEHIPGNLLTTYRVSGGDWASAKSVSDIVVSRRLINNRLLPSPIETRGILASFNGFDETLDIWMGSQMPHMHRRWISEHLSFPENRLRVQTYDVGGGFGQKMHLYPEDLLVPFASILFKLPIRWIEGRSESHLSSTHGRAHTDYIEVAALRDGKVLGLRLKSYANVGAYLSNMAAGIPTINCANQATGNYAIDSFEAEVHLVCTNTQPVDAYRGAGRPEATYIAERAMDAVAAELGLDPIEVRRINFIKPSQFPYAPYGHERLKWDSGNYEACLNRAVDLLNVSQWRIRQKELRNEGRYIGIGVAAYTELCGVAPSVIFGMIGFERGGWESARISVHTDGSVTLYSGSMSTGQGHSISLAQIVATEFALPLSRIRTVQGDTAQLQFATGTYNSRSIAVGGTAVLLCARKIIDRASAYAAEWLGIARDDVLYEDGEFKSRVDETVDPISFSEVASAAQNAHVRPSDTAPVLEETVFYDPVGTGNPNGVHAVVVEIDINTGGIELLDYVAVDDIGTVINPKLAEGQLLGGIAQGIGQALTEEVRYDIQGLLKTKSFQDYAIPRASLFPMIRMEFLNTVTPTNPLGAKGVGEAGTVAAPPAIVSAVCDALSPFGVSHIDMPLTPAKVWSTINNSPRAMELL